MPRPTLPKTAILIVNTRSRIGAEAFPQAVELLGQAGIKLLAAHAVDDPRRIKREAVSYTHLTLPTILLV